MATSSSISSTITSTAAFKAPVHGGLERMISVGESIAALVSSVQLQKKMRSISLGVTMMAVVTITARALDESQIGFVTEMLVLSVVALCSLALFSTVVRGVKNFINTTAKQCELTFSSQQALNHGSQEFL